MPNFFTDPLGSTAGALLAGTSGAAQVGVWAASELAKFGKTAGGRPGEVTFAFLGAGSGAMAGFFLGSVLGALSGSNMVNYFVGNLKQALPDSPFLSSGGTSGDDPVESFRRLLLANPEPWSRERTPS